MGSLRRIVRSSRLLPLPGWGGQILYRISTEDLTRHLLRLVSHPSTGAQAHRDLPTPDRPPFERYSANSPWRRAGVCSLYPFPGSSCGLACGCWRRWA